MSWLNSYYPPPRYHGDQGEPSARFRAADSEPDLTTKGGGRTHYLATHASTDGDFGLYRVDMGPGVSGTGTPPGGLHSFRNESGEPTSFLMLFAPGAQREGRFEGLGRLAGLSDAERAEFFIHHDSYFVAPADDPSGDALTNRTTLA